MPLCHKILNFDPNWPFCNVKVPMKWKIEVLKNRRNWRAFKSEEWCFPFCHTLSRSRDIQDFCIMQIRYWWRQKMWIWKSKHKIEFWILAKIASMKKTLNIREKFQKTCPKPFYKSFTVVLCKNPLQKTLNIPRNETILKIGHHAKAIAHATSSLCVKN